jgi:TonB family protein
MFLRTLAYFFTIVIIIFCTPAFSKWDKTVEKDDFDDSKFQIWYTAASLKNGGGEFVFGCGNQKKLSFYWQHSKRGVDGIMAMDMDVTVRLDSDAPTGERWYWVPANATIRPNDAAAFMKKIMSKQKIAIKLDLGVGAEIGIFDISGLDKAYQEAKTLCKLDQSLSPRPVVVPPIVKDESPRTISIGKSETQEEIAERERARQYEEKLAAEKRAKQRAEEMQQLYGRRVAAIIKSNTVLPPYNGEPSNPIVTFEFRLLPDGSPTAITKVKSSGFNEFDDAVKRAIEKSRFPPDPVSGVVPSDTITIRHRLRE